MLINQVTIDELLNAKERQLFSKDTNTLLQTIPRCNGVFVFTAGAEIVKVGVVDLIHEVFVVCFIPMRFIKAVANECQGILVSINKTHMSCSLY